jgi:LacI family transcriptional regulator
MQDVAARANVSISTVSRVLNRAELVSAATRTRVENAIRELGYRPNAFARGLMLRRSEIIGLVLPDIHGEFYSEIIRGANIRARELGYNLVVASGRDGDESHTLLDAMQQRTILDGVAVMVPELTDQMRDILTDFTRPFVVLDCDVPGARHDCVLIDQHHGARTMTEHLIRNRGIRRIVFVGGQPTNVDTLQRLDACRAALQAAHLALPAGDVHHLDYQYDSAYALALDHMNNWLGPDHCIFAANDEMAAGIIAAALGLGVRIPDDVAVVGFDDTRIARMSRPTLTTVRVPTTEMGAHAVELLCGRIADRSQAPRRVLLQPQLVVRESCGTAETRAAFGA